MKVVGRIITATTSKAEAEVTGEVRQGDDLLQFEHNGGGKVECKVLNLLTTRGRGVVATLQFEKTLDAVPRLFTPLTFPPLRVSMKVSLHLGESNGRKVWVRINGLFSGGLLIGGLTQEGKTHLGLVIAEELMQRRVPILIIDSQGEFVGLRETFPDIVTILEENATATGILSALVKRKTVVLNLLGCSNSRKAEIVAPLLQELRTEKEADYTHARPSYPPFVLLLDEAEIFAPSHTHRAAVPECREIINDIVKRMGKFGIASILIAQRLPMLDPDSRSQCGSSAFFRLTDAGSLAIAKLMSYVTDHDIRTIRHLPRGNCLLVGKIVTTSVVVTTKPIRSPRTKSLDFEKQLGLSETEDVIEESQESDSEPLTRDKVSKRNIETLARHLDVDPVTLAEQLPTITNKTFGEKRLEIFEKDGKVHARVWHGMSCILAMPIIDITEAKQYR